MITSPRGQLSVLILCLWQRPAYDITSLLVGMKMVWLITVGNGMSMTLLCFALKLFWRWQDWHGPETFHLLSGWEIAFKQLNYIVCLITEGKASPARHLPLPILSPSSYQPLGHTQSAFPCPPSLSADWGGAPLCFRRVYRPWMTIGSWGTNPDGLVNCLGVPGLCDKKKLSKMRKWV